MESIPKLVYCSCWQAGECCLNVPHHSLSLGVHKREWVGSHYKMEDIGENWEGSRAWFGGEDSRVAEEGSGVVGEDSEAVGEGNKEGDSYSCCCYHRQGRRDGSRLRIRHDGFGCGNSFSYFG